MHLASCFKYLSLSATVTKLLSGEKLNWEAILPFLAQSHGEAWQGWSPRGGGHVSHHQEVSEPCLSLAAMAADERDYNLTEEQKAVKAKYPPLNKKYECECF